jgi:ApaG protein
VSKGRIGLGGKRKRRAGRFLSAFRPADCGLDWGVPCNSLALPGLTATLDKLSYHHGGLSLPPDKPHAFVYFITIRNGSESTVTLLGRKWVVVHADGTRLVVEGDKIVGETPRLAPGEQFSYNSYHVTGCDAKAYGSFHGVDQFGHHVHVLMPPFDLRLPPAGTPG